MIFCTGQWLLGVRCWGGFLALPSCRSAIWTSRCPSPSWMKTNPLAYEDEPLALLCLPAHCCLSVIRLWQASLLLLFLLPLNVPTKDLVTQCGCCVLADVHSVQQLSSWPQVRGLELAVPLWKCSVTLWFGLVSKPWASKQWKRCKCVCNGRIKCFFYSLHRWILLLTPLPAELRSVNFVHCGAMGSLKHLLRKSVCGQISLSNICVCMMLNTKISMWFFSSISNKNNTVCLMSTVSYLL